MKLKSLFVKSMIGVCFLTLSQQANAQKHEATDVPFNGLVTDMLGQPVKRAIIYTETKNKYSLSDKEGKFGLTNVHPTDTIHIRYKRQLYLIPVEGRKGLKIRLGDTIEANEDEQLVSYGFSYVKRREILTPTSYLSGEELEKSGQTNLLEALKGRVAGMRVEGNNVIIRGISSINLDCYALYVVDGVVVTSLDYLNVHDVKSVEVLKDGSMYGVRGAGGVISVKTKKGGE